MYDSRHGATRKISPAAKLAEMACERIAEHQGRSLPVRFWQPEHREWAKAFREQMIFANSLLKVFEPAAVMRAMEGNPRVRSLGAPFFVAEVKNAERAVSRERQLAETSSPVEVRSTTERPREAASADSIRKRLGKLDGRETGSEVSG